MSDKAWPTRLCNNLRRLVKQTSNVANSVYTAVGLLAVASVLMVTVVFGLTNPQYINSVKPVPPNEPQAVTTDKTSAAVPAATQASNSEPIEQAGRSSKPSEKALPAEPAPPPKVIYKPENAQHPLKGEITRAFGWNQHEVYKDWRYHTGIDISSPEGAAVAAMWGGEAIKIYDDNNTGLTVEIKTGEYTVIYGALASSSVKPGQTVAPGSKIGTVGRSKAEPYGHLHLAVKKGDQFIDPQIILH